VSAGKSLLQPKQSSGLQYSRPRHRSQTGVAAKRQLLPWGIIRPISPMSSGVSSCQPSLTVVDVCAR
jgi:hypothetical protein